MIRLLLASVILACMALPAHADTRDVYTVRNIEVDEQAASVIEARDKAMSVARQKAARALLTKITLSDDRAAAGGLPVDYALAERLSAAVDVQEETAGAGRYRGVLSVVLNPLMVRAHLDGLGVPYVDTQGPKSLIVPLASNYSTQESWRAALGIGNASALAPYVTASNPGYTAFSDWSAFSTEAATVGARRGVLAELSGSGGAYRVTLSTVTAAGTELLGTTSSSASMQGAVDAATAFMDEDWKRPVFATLRWPSGTRCARRWHGLRWCLISRSPRLLVMARW